MGAERNRDGLHRWRGCKPSPSTTAFGRMMRFPVIKRGRIICFANSKGEADQIASALNHVEEFEQMCARIREELDNRPIEFEEGDPFADD